MRLGSGCQETRRRERSDARRLPQSSGACASSCQTVEPTQEMPSPDWSKRWEATNSACMFRAVRGQSVCHAEVQSRLV